MNYQYHQWWNTIHHKREKMVKKKKKKREANMMGSGRDMHWSQYQYKNKNQHIYIASGWKVIICPNSMRSISRGLRGSSIWLHIYCMRVENWELRLKYNYALVISTLIYFRLMQHQEASHGPLSRYEHWMNKAYKNIWVLKTFLLVDLETTRIDGDQPCCTSEVNSISAVRDLQSSSCSPSRVLL